MHVGMLGFDVGVPEHLVGVAGEGGDIVATIGQLLHDGTANITSGTNDGDSHGMLLVS